MLKKIALVRFSFLALAAVLVSGCAAGPGGGPQKQSASQISGTSGQDASLAKGRGYFMRECIKCHRIFSPEERSPAEWDAILKRKAAKVSLTKAQFDELAAYVLAASSAQQQSK